MRTIRHSKTLFYHDGPQVIVAIDDDGQNYIGVMVEPDSVEERFILKAVASNRLDHFQAGMIDLRSLLLESPGGEWFLGTMGRTFDEPFILRSQTGPLDEFPCLPEPGFFLSEPEELKENPSGRETEGVSAGKPLEIGPPPLRREVEEGLRNPG
jgi:hypothetical protein